MCYETALTKKKKELENHFKATFDLWSDFKPYFHKTGFSYSNLQIITMEQPNLILPASWGLVPEWGAKDISAFRKKYNMLNTKSETLFSGLSKGSALTKRCIILADGFFEPHKIANISIPNFCYIPSNDFSDGRDIFAFAGIYTELDNVNLGCTCSILTVEANEFFAEIHNVKKRMPLVLDRGLYGEWMDDGNKEADISELMKNGFTSKEFAAHPVSRTLYDRTINTNTAEILKQDNNGLLF